MISFVIALILLVVGYFVYGKFTERVFGIDSNRPTPAITKADGIDYIAMPTWRVFLIQFLNIAGLGPIFGAIMGILFGPAAYLWIVFGTIFAGAVHDYLSGMMSLRRDGMSLPEIVGEELGTGGKAGDACLCSIAAHIGGCGLRNQSGRFVGRPYGNLHRRCLRQFA